MASPVIRDNTSVAIVDVSMPALEAWCVRWLEAGIDEVLFATGHLSRVVGVRLTDRRDVVVKIRPRADRLAACAEVQLALWRSGFPCPQPLVGPVPLDGHAANAEAYIPGGDVLDVAGDAVVHYAQLLARLVQLAPRHATGLAPNPPWVAWDHGHGGVWPPPDDRVADLNALPETAWLDEIGQRVQRRLHRMPSAPTVVGHGDWESHNLRWHGRTPFVVHDWDSLVTGPEPVIVGLAASVWSCGARPRAATLDESQAFIEAYQHATGRTWSSDETEASWAAGLWVYAFNTKKVSLDGLPWLDPDEADERLRRSAA
jgi:Ser/Thr protein kinase RdoA (MazF antagonist)